MVEELTLCSFKHNDFFSPLMGDMLQFWILKIKLAVEKLVWLCSEVFFILYPPSPNLENIVIPII